LSSGQSPIVGIDLGTTYSLVAVMRDGVPTPLPNAVGEMLTPSAVSVDPLGKLLVGAPARARATTYPGLTALAFKRDMGTDRVYRLGGTAMTPQELSAMVLAALKRDAEEALGLPVEEAVITVPAYFDDMQRQATRAAGEIAGLRVERILNEPTAAALAYGLHQRNRELRAVVLDLGGGTFDVTVLEIIEGVIEIQASAGDSRLGGEDFVEVMAGAVASRVQALHGRDPRAHPLGWARLREACEDAKRRLSHVEETRIALPQLPVAEGGPLDLELPLTRAEMEEVWTELLERIRTPISRALRDAKLRPDQIGEVLLVGGATRMPCVVRLAAQLFGRLPLRSLPPDEAVALGAAVQAGLKQGDASLEDMVVTDIAPFTLGIATATRMGHQIVPGLFTPLIDRGTVIPASRVKRFHTIEDFQRQIDIEVYQGEHSLCKDNRRLGSYLVGPLPSDKEGRQAVDVRFTYDLNGILEVETTVLATCKAETLVLEQTPGRLSREQIEEARLRMARLKFHPRESLPNATALARAEALFMELTGPEREELGNALSAFHAALETQDAEAINYCRQRLNQLVEAYRRS
jgi:molecular chaperone HscC